MIPVHHDGEAVYETKERCAFCRTPTNYWHAGKDVACCQDCARTRKVSELPSKREWIAKEMALNPPLVRRIAVSDPKQYKVKPKQPPLEMTIDLIHKAERVLHIADRNTVEFNDLRQAIAQIKAKIDPTDAGLV